jgi:riboflavin kinase/FMN adenylyltransferase
MRVLTGPPGSARIEGPTAATLGVFDGVHRGHEAVIRRAVDLARRTDMPAVAVTFDRHPQTVLRPGSGPPLITSLERRIELIAALGVDIVVVLRFDVELASWSPERFARTVLSEDLRAHRVVVGENFTFGNRAAGTVATLVSLGPALGFEAEGVPILRLQGRRVSSSSIREAVSTGELAWPKEALGRPFALDGRVVTGAGRGVALGFPTANLEVPAGMLMPGRGVYAGRAGFDGAVHGAAIDVGTNPTFGVEPLHVEAHLLDFDGDLRGRELSLEFLARLRDEERFDSIDELIRRIDDDVVRTRRVLAGLADDAAAG